MSVNDCAKCYQDRCRRKLSAMNTEKLKLILDAIKSMVSASEQLPPADEALHMHPSENVKDAMQRIDDHNKPTDEQVWLSMWASVANAESCQTVDAATRWADQGLMAYRKRFCPK